MIASAITERGLSCEVAVDEVEDGLVLCGEPAAARVQYLPGTDPMLMCSECYDRVRRQSDPTLKELRLEVGWIED